MYAVLGKRWLRMASFLLLLGFVFIIEGIIITGAEPTGDMRDAEIREKYLINLGFGIVSESLIETEVMIPKEFGDAYMAYNKLQTEAGFNLLDYRGLAATKYSYEALNYNGEERVLVTILCRNGKLIGGDVSSPTWGGFMLPLK